MSDPILFLGRFHPLVLHLPIGLLAGVAFLESALLTLRLFPRLRQRLVKAEASLEHALHMHLPGLEAAARVILAFAAVAACGAALLVLMLAARGDFSGPSFVWHKWLGIGTAVGASVAA